MSKATIASFWSSPSTLLVTIIRLIIIVIPHVVDLETVFPSNWLYSSSLTFLLVKPHQTLSHIREARAIQRLVSGKFADAYVANQKIRLPPLVLAALTPILDYDYPELFLSLFLLLVDFFIAGMLEAIGRRVLFSPNPSIDQEEEEQAKLPKAIRPPYAHIFPICRDSTNSLLPMDALPLLAARIYYWSPTMIVSGGIYHCFQNLATLCFVTSLYECVTGKSYILSTLYLAAAAYMELYHVVFLVPFALLRSHQTATKAFQFVVSFTVWFACLQGLSYGLVGPDKFGSVLQATYGCGWINMSPSLSVQWYFAMQMFSRFRDYFGALLTGLPYLMVAPLTIRLYKYPMVLVAMFSMIWTIFRPVQTLYDMNLSLCFFLFCPLSLARMEKISFFSLFSIWVPVLLNVVDHWMWMEPNTGNPNYMFFQCLAYNVFLGILLGQLCTASLQRDKALRLSAKERAADCR